MALAATPLAESLIAALRARGLTLGTVESCTGGLVAAALTDIAGSSDVFMGSVVAYANRIKHALADVPNEAINAHGAVSETVAKHMAEGGRQRLGVDVCVAITGIAGPGGGTPEKPVGLVHIAAIGPRGLMHHQAVFPGNRTEVREAAVQAALTLIRDVI